jgi:exodeoxyribonuclease VII small subunit
MADTEVGELSFEKALEELQQIVAKLEQGNLSMDESLTLFERGTELARQCQARLDEAEFRVAQLTRREDGTIREGELEKEE